jgi:hypothetical protein
MLTTGASERILREAITEIGFTIRTLALLAFLAFCVYGLLLLAGVLHR